MKTIVLSIFLSFMMFFAAAQETKTPLKRNVVLNSLATPLKPAKQTEFNKKASTAHLFPFIDRFASTDPALSDSFWIQGHVTKVGASVVFNGITALGGVHSTVPGDILTTRAIDLREIYDKAYLEFTYSTGSTFSPNDSLVLQFQTSSGGWQTIWRSTSSAATFRTVYLDLPSLANYNFATFQFRFASYTVPSAVNTETFVLSSVVFARKYDLSWYESFLQFGSDLFPLKSSWSQAQTEIARPSSGYGNVAVFDARDVNNQFYSGTSGNADTLQSHPVDLNAFALTDSVYLSFFYRALQATAGDELVLQVRNNVSAWTTIDSFAATSSAVQTRYIRQINIGKLRSSNFQFRLINRTTYTSTDTLDWIATGFQIGLRISLPFEDDFSASDVFPNPSIWADKDVFINNDFPIHPPSIQVATFDGLDSRGNAYAFSGRGVCDKLTSHSINLGGLQRSDSVYMTFYFQPMGLGDFPASGDSLILEFRNSAADPNSFVTVWGVLPAGHRTDSFTGVSVFVDSAFLHDDFQFRFKNYGSLTGNIDHWHVDYIRMERGRFRNDFAYSDVAISTTPQNLLKIYRSMPWDHFTSNRSTHQRDSQYFYERNHQGNGNSVNFSREVKDGAGTQLDYQLNLSPNINGGTELLLNNSKPVTLTPFISGDTVLFTSEFVAKLLSSDNIPSNDSVTVPTVFSNYFAYDDGTAETGYAIKNAGGAVALGYQMSHSDTIYGLAVHFNQSSTDVSTRGFTFVVYSSVGPSGTVDETVLKKIPFPNPVYTNKRNGFFYYKFDEPLAVPAHFYIGWEQSQVFELNVGLDENFLVNEERLPNPDMFVKFSDQPQWRPTALTGALMMRPIVGKWVDPPVGIPVSERTRIQFSVYPNPAKSMLHIESDLTGPVDAELFDIAGRKILSLTTDGDFPLPALQSGIYLLRIFHEGVWCATKKIIIEQ